MVAKGQKFPPEGDGLPDTALQQKDPAGRHRQDTNALDAAGGGKQPAGKPLSEPGAGGTDDDRSERPRREEDPKPGEDPVKDMDDPDHVPGP